jgi:uncharacterized membrane protein
MPTVVDATPTVGPVVSATHTTDPLAKAVGLVLRWGVLLAAAITAVGGVVLLRTSGGNTPQFSTFTAPTAATSTVTGILRGAFQGRGAELIQAGLLVLIATPVSRVIMLLIGFWRERRWLYVALSAIVLAALSVSLAQTR